MGTGLANNTTGAVNMGDGILVGTTEEARWNIGEGDLVLVTHTTKSRKGVMNKGNVLENKAGRDVLTLLEGRGNQSEALHCVDIAWDILIRQGWDVANWQG